MKIDLAKPGTQAGVASMVGVTQQAISAMVTEGKMPASGSLGELVLAYCQRLRAQAAGRLGEEAGPLDLVQERAALAREQRISMEIKNALARGEYAPITLLSEVLANASQAVSERFEQLPGILRKACPTLPNSARDKVMSTIADARNAWVVATVELVMKSLEEDDDDEPADDA